MRFLQFMGVNEIHETLNGRDVVQIMEFPWNFQEGKK